MISLSEPTSVAPPRRVALGAEKMIALERAAQDAGIQLPEDLVLQVDPVGAALAGLDVDAVVAAADVQLREHGVMDAQGPIPAVAANLAALGGAERRMRVAVGGPGINRLGYFWADAAVGGSLVRQELTYTLSAFESRALGAELLAVLPDADDDEAVALREAFSVPLDAVGPAAALPEDQQGEVAEALADLLGMSAAELTQLQEWSARIRAVVHVLVVGPGGPHGLVWFLDRDGWWSGELSRTDADGRHLSLAPRKRVDAVDAVAELCLGAWL